MSRHSRSRDYPSAHHARPAGERSLLRALPSSQRRLNAARRRSLNTGGAATQAAPPEEQALERDLVRQAQHGDQEAFGVLARTNGDWLFAVAQRILRDFDRAKDAVQQTLVIAWRELPTLRDPDRCEAWLRRLLVRVCCVEIRRTRRIDAVIRVSRRQARPTFPFRAAPGPPVRVAAATFQSAHSCSLSSASADRV
jgi:DNA-directed RNA polymerase specialized sigma24 family protein